MQSWSTVRVIEGKQYVELQEAEQKISVAVSEAVQQELRDAIGRIASATGEIEKTVKEFKQDSNLILG